jgi:hypothetical protein
MRTRIVALALSLIPFSWGPTVAAQSPASGARESLKGLPGLFVLVEHLNPDAERDGLTDDVIRTAVEQRLRLAGIRVLANSEELFASNPATAYLYINVQAERGQMAGSNLYVYRIDVELNQWLQSQVTGSEIPGVTWHRGALGTARANNIRDLHHITLSLTDQFINDFLAANPPTRY